MSRRTDGSVLPAVPAISLAQRLWVQLRRLCRSSVLAGLLGALPHAVQRNPPANWLVLSLQPQEGLTLQFDAPAPGAEVTLAPVGLQFHYTDWFEPLPNIGYETLLHDVMTGDQTQFRSTDMVTENWRAVQPVLDAWRTAPDGIASYPAGSQGPTAADQLLGERKWRPIDK